MPTPKGYVPKHKQTERNEEIVREIRSGTPPIACAEKYGVSRQRICQIWQAHGGENLHWRKRGPSFRAQEPPEPQIALRNHGKFFTLEEAQEEVREEVREEAVVELSRVREMIKERRRREFMQTLRE